MGQDYTDEAGKIKHHDNPFIEPVQTQTVVDMKGKVVFKYLFAILNFENNPDPSCRCYGLK